MTSKTDRPPIRKITPIPRGADLTDDDLALLVEDFYEVRNWCALIVRLGVDDLKRHCLAALKVRLGRSQQVGMLTDLPPRAQVLANLKRAMVTAINDDRSRAGTEERARYVERIDALTAAIHLIENGD